MTVVDHPRTAVPAEVRRDAPARPRWFRPALALLLVGTAALYLFRLGRLGWANEFYAAAAQAGTQDLTAWLFGSLDPNNVVTVDKPPASLWVMALSGRLFGFSSWSLLVPQALMGVAAVALLVAAVRRSAGHGAGLLAGVGLALTPVAALMFRYDNPDALLVLLLVAAAYCVVRATERHPARWLALAGVALGTAFLAKLLQAFLVAPALALVVLVAVPGSVWVRLRGLAVGLAATVVSGGWFVALVELWPASSRPYIGGSTDNSLLELTLGYNGLGRVFGGDGNPTGGAPGGPPPGVGAAEGLAPGGPGGPGGAMFGGEAGLGRLFNASLGTEISWLLPAAAVALLVGLWLTRRAPRTDPTRAGLLLWGGWSLVTGAVFSAMQGIMHPYYTVALAPAVAAVAAIGVTLLWRRRAHLAARLTLAVMLVGTATWALILLRRTPDWLPWLGPTLVVSAVVVASVLVAGLPRLGRGARITLAAAALLVALGASGAYTVETVVGAHASGTLPVSGPAREGAADGGFGANGGPGRLDDATTAALEQLVEGSSARWAAATIGSHGSGSLQLATGRAVMAIGGFMGGDPAPTLAQFQQWVADGDVGWFVVTHDGPDGRGGPGGENAIAAWVGATFPAQTVGGATVYRLAP